MNPSTVFLFFIIATLFVASSAVIVFSGAQQQDLPPNPPPLSDDGAAEEADDSASTTTTATPRNWYRAIFNGSNYDTVSFQKGLATQFAYYQYGTWFVQTYPDPPTYDRTNNIFDFQFAFVSTNSTKRDTVFRQYLTDDPNIQNLKKVLFESSSNLNLYSIVTSDAPVDTTRSPPAQKQWFFMKLSGQPYNRPHLQQCMINALSALAACVIETDPDSPAYDADSNTRSFKFAFIDDNFVKHQDALMSYLKVKPDFGQLYDACFQPSFKISIKTLTVTTTPDSYTTPPPTDPNSNNGDGNNNNSPLIPGLENWMSFTLIGVGAFVIVAVSFLVILNYCRSQDEADSSNVVGGNQSRKNVKFNNRKNIGEAAMAYQQADDEMNGTTTAKNEEKNNKNNNSNGERQSQSLQEQT